MREIKFRIWIPEAKIKYNGDMYYQEDQYLSSFLQRVYDQFQTTHPTYLPFEVEERLMQYTGLKDKNGREIYEGDIVSCDQSQGYGKVVGIVHFGIDDRSSSGWCDPRIYLDTRPFQKHNGSEFCIFHIQPEVIGNIWENGELVSQEDK